MNIGLIEFARTPGARDKKPRRWSRSATGLGLLGGSMVLNNTVGQRFGRKAGVATALAGAGVLGAAGYLQKRRDNKFKKQGYTVPKNGWKNRYE